MGNLISTVLQYMQKDGNSQAALVVNYYFTDSSAFGSRGSVSGFGLLLRIK